MAWVLDRTAKFPKNTRFGLVQKIEGIALRLLELKPSGYIRYTDDILLFGDDKEAMQASRDRLLTEFTRERLRPHPRKCRVHACREWVPFLGFRFFPDRVRVLRANAFSFKFRSPR